MKTDNDEKLDSAKEDSSISEESSSLAHPEVESKLEKIIDDLPKEKQQLMRHTIREMFVGIMGQSSTPQISPEVARIVTEIEDKDNQRKFEFLSQKQADDAESEKREDDLRLKQHEFRCTKHERNFSLVKPIIWAIIITVVGTTVAGIWLCVIGKEAIGAAILSGIWGAVFGYLAGFGTSNFFKDQEEN